VVVLTHKIFLCLLLSRVAPKITHKSFGSVLINLLFKEQDIACPKSLVENSTEKTNSYFSVSSILSSIVAVNKLYDMLSQISIPLHIQELIDTIDDKIIETEKYELIFSVEFSTKLLGHAISCCLNNRFIATEPKDLCVIFGAARDNKQRKILWLNTPTELVHTKFYNAIQLLEPKNLNIPLPTVISKTSEKCLIVIELEKTLRSTQLVTFRGKPYMSAINIKAAKNMFKNIEIHTPKLEL